MKKNLNRAFVRLDAAGRVVPGSLLFRPKRPREGRWYEILADACCGVDPNACSTAYVYVQNDTIGNATVNGVVISPSGGRIVPIPLNTLDIDSATDTPHTVRIVDEDQNTVDDVNNPTGDLVVDLSGYTALVQSIILF